MGVDTFCRSVTCDWKLARPLFYVCASPQLIFEKEGVYLHTNAKRSNQDTTLPGFIRIVERVSTSVGVKAVTTRRDIQQH